MESQKGNEVSKESAGNVWSRSQNEKLLEFIILNPYIIFQQFKFKTIPLLHKHINSNKTQKSCLYKINNILRNNPSIDQLVKTLSKKAKVDEKWILQRKKQSQYVKIEDFSGQIGSIRQNFTFEQKALRLFVSNFSCNEALAIKFTKPQLLLKLLPIEQKNTIESEYNDGINFNQSRPVSFNHESVEEDLPEHLQRLRYVLFLEKYKKQLENTEGIKKIESKSHKMAKFIRTKNSQAWGAYHKNRLKAAGGDLQVIIQKEKNNLYIKKDELMKQLDRINEFYQNDLKRQMNAFGSKSYFIIESTNEQIKYVVQQVVKEVKKIQQKKTQQKSFAHANQKTEAIEQPSKDAKISKERRIEQYVIEIPIELSIILQTKQNELNTIQKQVKQLKKILRTSKDKSQNQVTLSKKDQLKQKKLQKSNIHKILANRKKLIFSPEKKNDSGQQLYLSSDERNESFNSNLFNHYAEQKTVKKHQILKDSNSQIIIEPQPSNQEENLSIELQDKKKSQSYESQEKGGKPSWTVSQIVKMLGFLVANKATFLDGGYVEKYDISRKLATFVGGSQSHQQCKSRFQRIKIENDRNFFKTLDSQAGKFGVKIQFFSQLQELQDNYMEKININVGSSDISVSIFPFLLTMSSWIDEMYIEKEIEKMIKYGPVIEVSLQDNVQMSKDQKDDKKCTIKLDETAKISLKIKLQFEKKTSTKIETTLKLVFFNID